MCNVLAVNSQITQEPSFLVLAHQALGAMLLTLGELGASRAHFERGMARYDPPQHRSQAPSYGEVVSAKRRTLASAIRKIEPSRH